MAAYSRFVTVAGPRALQRLLEAVLTIGDGLDLPTTLHRIVEAAADLVDARYGALGVLDPSGTRLSQFITVGLDDDQRARIGALPEGHGILGALILDAQPLRLPDLTEHPDSFGFPPGHPPMHSFLGVPIRLRDQVFGNLYLADKQSAEVFTDVDEELVVQLASAAGIAIDNARLHSRVHELGLVEDRERIARDLHDTVIQRLFATGLSLQAATRLVRTDADSAVDRVAAAIDDLDVTIKEIRSAIFGLESQPALTEGTRKAIVDMIREASRSIGFEPRVTFEGPIDAGVDEGTAADLLATLREALSNVARHAHATRVDVSVTVGADLCLTVTDDGVGPPPAEGPGNGLRNMSARAEARHGSMAVSAAPLGGTRIEWRASRS